MKKVEKDFPCVLGIYSISDVDCGCGNDGFEVRFGFEGGKIKTFALVCTVCGKILVMRM